MTMGFARFASRHVPSHDGQLPFALVGLFLSHLLEEGFTFMQADFHKRPHAMCMVSQVLYMIMILISPDDPEFHNVNLFHKITIRLLCSELPLSNNFASRHIRTHQFLPGTIGEVHDIKHEVLTCRLRPSTPVACPTFFPSLNTIYVGTCHISRFQ